MYLESAPALAAIVATAIERIVALYKKVLEIRKLRLEIARLETPEKVWKPFEDHEKAFEEKEINEIAKRLVGECYEGKDKGRKNELVVGVASALAYLATRIDHGVTVEVRTPNPEEPEKPEAAADSDPEHERLMQSYEEQKRFAEEVNRSGRPLGALERDEKPILLLSSKDDDETQPKQEKPKKPKKEKES